MAFTIGADMDDTAGLDFDIRLEQSDALAETIRKIFSVRNVGGDVQNAMRAYEGATQASIDSAGVAIQAVVTGASTTIGTAGLFPKIGDQLVLGFSRPHPVVAGKLVKKAFVIPAPHPDVYDTTTKKPVMIRGEAFVDALAADRPTALGSLVDWLEDALLYEHDGTVYAGSFTYSDALSGLIGQSREYDGDDLT